MIKLSTPRWNGFGGRLAHCAVFAGVLVGGFVLPAHAASSLVSALDDAFGATVIIQEDGFYSLRESVVRVNTAQTNALPFRVWVQHGEDSHSVVKTHLAGGTLFTYDNFLGYLVAGDRVCARLGEEGEISSGLVEYQVVSNPAIFVSDFPPSTYDEASRGWSIDHNVGASLSGGRALLELGSGGARVLFKVPHSGYYALTQTSAVRIEGDDEVRIRIETSQDNRMIRELVFPGNDVEISFNADLGYVAKGTEICIKLASKEDVVKVGLQARMVEWVPRQAPLRVERGQNGYLAVREPNHTDTLRVIAPDRWITVAPRRGDSTDALRKAFAKAQALADDGDYAGVRLQAGKVYSLGTGQTGGTLFEFSEAQKLIFDGNHAVFRINTTDLRRKETKLFSFSNCRLMAFADITVEAVNGQPYTFGEVIDVKTLSNGDQEITFRVPTNQPDPVKDIRQNGMAEGYAYDTQHPGRLADGSWSHYPGGRNIRPQLRATGKPRVFVHTVTRTGNSIKVGDQWVVKNKRGGVIYLEARSAMNITLSGLDAKAHGGGAVRNWGATINLLNCRFDLQKSDLMSSSADSVHGRGREGVWIEDTVFRGTCEDILNTYANSMLVLEDESDTDNVITLHMGSRKRGGAFSPGSPVSSKSILIGDQLVFFNPQKGTVLGMERVRAVEDGRVTLSNSIEGIDYWDEGDNNRSTVVYNQTSAAKVFIRDSSFLDSMRFGAFLKADHVVIFNSRFEGLAASAVYAANEPGWPEGPPAEHLWIQDCTFKDNGYGYTSKHRAHIVVDPADISVFTSRLRASGEPNEYSALLSRAGYANSHIKIIGNTFKNWRGMAIAIRNSRNVVIDGNAFFAPIDDPVMRTTMAQTPILSHDGEGLYAAIYLNTVNGATVSNNRFYEFGNSDQEIVLDKDALNVVVDGNSTTSTCSSACASDQKNTNPR